VVGDNIANANTVGFKSSRANFEDVLARSLGGGVGDVGLGSRLADVQQILTQGALLGTGIATDLAIKGDGYFAVKGSAEGLDSTFYTRAGQFYLDKDGYMVNSEQLKVQGYVVNAAGTLVKTVTDVKVENSQMPPVATTAAQVIGNLDSDAVIPTMTMAAALAAVPQTPEAASNFSTSVTVYDSLGKDHSVTIYFRKDAQAPAGQTWSWNALVDGGELTGGTAGTWVQCANGTMNFDTDGKLVSQATAATDFDFVGATQNQAIAFDFGDDTASGGTGLKGVANYASSSTVTYIDQDGYGSGALSGISIASDGVIDGLFNNGMRRTVGQVLLADFQSPQELQRIGGNLFISTEASGPALIGEAASGGRGTIAAGSLEQSNVDLAQQFVDMIAFQRGFQANSRTITTADQMLAELVALKR